MAIVVNMPRLSDTMEEGVVAKWHKSVGDQVNEGDLLAEIETDKATMEFEAMPGQEGELLYIGVEEGGTSPVDAVLCILGAKGEDIEALKTAAPSAEAPVTKEEPKAEEAQAPVKDESKSTPAPAAAPVAAAVTTASSANGRVVASPLAKKLAQEKGIDIALVNGSGEGGRVVKRDIDNYVPSAAPTASVAMADNTYEEVAVSQMRKTIARRLSDSKFSAPHFYLTMEIDMDNAIKARKQMNAGGDVRISFNDLVVKAAALALRQHKAVNAGWYGDTIRYYNYINVGIAVAVDEGLLVPVVRNTDFQSLSQISTEVRRLAGMAKDKKLQPSDWEGNTFTISNLGMFGID
ncbi:MAG: 2-oxo acid dehydrogenase subunit E2, partial [Schleiferiaceae bacterium]|nr:2-oxo acid dehydrogenase subunit E2 [Schleiferiaceae bacterium]